MAPARITEPFVSVSSRQRTALHLGICLSMVALAVTGGLPTAAAFTPVPARAQMRHQDLSLADVPGGEYRLSAWHERLGRSRKPIVVVAGRTATIEFALPVGTD